jgi:16S rRNA (guanine527-N7)-methyltransferase
MLIEKLEADLSQLRDLTVACGLVFDDIQLEKMCSFMSLLLEWNRSINLISRGEAERLVGRHIAESVGLLVLADLPLSARVMDVGSGGGFPAIPMKILRPDISFTLTESNRKKAAFLRNVGIKLSLRDYFVNDQRVEMTPLANSLPYAVITARAVAELGILWRWTENQLLNGGRLLAIKGGSMEEEIEALREAENISEVLTIEFPKWLNIEKSRFVIAVRKK